MKPIETEYKEIKSDLRDLKSCQRQYFFLSISGAGAILALARYVEEYAGFPMLAALLFVLPCWKMFFDKASSVTRTSGYIAYLESQMASESPVFVGYEKAVIEFRRRDDLGEFKSVPNDEQDNRPTRSRYGYWMINFITYLSVCIACLISAAAWAIGKESWADGANKHVFWWSFAVCAAAFMIVLISTSADYWALRRGKHSYKAMKTNWGQVLDFDNGGFLKLPSEETGPG